MKPGRHICTACNAIYEEPDEKLDPTKQPFESLPADWKCECGAGKETYQPCSCVEIKGQPTEHKHSEACEQSCNP
jgi:rubredoxin